MDSIAHNNNTEFSPELLRFIKEGKFERAKQILQSTGLYHSSDSSGCSLLHYSVYFNNINFTQYLLDQSCDVNTQNLGGYTPLMIATLKDYKAIVQKLLTARADILKLHHSGKSVLHMLSMQHTIQFHTIQLLLQELKKQCSTSEDVADQLIVSGCPIYVGVLLRESRIVEYMAKQAIPVTYAHPTKKVTGIHLSTLLDDPESFRLLLKFGADADALDALNENPLYNLYKRYPEHNCQKMEILRMLVNQRVSMTNCTRTGVFHVYHVLIKGNRKVIRLLLQSGLDFNAKDERANRTIVHYLAGNTQPGVSNELKPYLSQFDINTRDKFGQTPLFIACVEGNIRMAKFFLVHNAKTNLSRNILCTTPLYYAYKHMKPGCQSQYHQIGELLLQSNADPQSISFKKTGEAETILDDALEKRDFERVKPIIAHLALLEKLGTPIIEMILTKINLHRFLKIYFLRCRWLLKRRIFGRLTLFNFLTSDKKKIARYLNNKNIVQKLNDKCFLKTIRFRSYYYNTLRRRYLEGKRYKKIENEAAKVLSKIFQNSIHETHLVVRKICSYLDDRSLQQLRRLDCNSPNGQVIVTPSKITDRFKDRIISSSNEIRKPSLRNRINRKQIYSPDKAISL